MSFPWLLLEEDCRTAGLPNLNSPWQDAV